MNASPQTGGAKSAAAPSNIRHRPITGTTRTENAPPVTMAVPYNKSQTRGKGHGDEGFDQPDCQPSARRDLPGGRQCGHQRGDPHGHPAPTGHSGKFGSALHGFADVAEMIGGASVDGDGLAWRRVQRTGGRHASSLAHRLPLSSTLPCKVK